MCRPAFSGLILNLLGGLALPGLLQAQAPTDHPLTLELLQRIEQLEQDVRYMRGELELYRHQLELLQREHLDTLRERGEWGSPTAASPPVTSAPPGQPTPAVSAPSTATPPAATPNVVTPSSAEQVDFDSAIDHLRAGRHAEATAAFQRFLKTWPNGGRADDAQYWLGETYYRSRNYPAARDAFINLGLHFPQSKRLPDALLKLGTIYSETGDVVRAREVLQKLIHVYPDTEAARLAKERLAGLPTALP